MFAVCRGVACYWWHVLRRAFKDTLEFFGHKPRKIVLGVIVVLVSGVGFAVWIKNLTGLLASAVVTLTGFLIFVLRTPWLLEKEMRQQIEIMEKRIHTLEDSKKNERLARLRDFIAKGKALSDWAKQSTDSPVYADARNGLDPWKDAVSRFLKDELPSEYLSYASVAAPYDLEKREAIIEFLDRKTAALERIEERFQG